MIGRVLFILSLLSLCCGISVLAQSKTMRVATYNIRYDNPNDAPNTWARRLPVMASQIQYHNFDIFGTQEVLVSQLKDLAAALPAYEHIGVGRDDGKEKGEFAAVFYNKDRYTLQKQGNFWLSETPEKPSKGWDAAIPRICTWGQFRDQETGFSFYFFNVHFDHIGEQARRESVNLVLQRIKQIAGNSPVVLAGDFNFSQNDEKYTALNTSGMLQDAYLLADVRYAPRGTFNGFDADRKSDERIDHIWLSSDFKVNRYGILTDTYGDGKFPSDHFPVVAEVQYNVKK